MVKGALASVLIFNTHCGSVTDDYELMPAARHADSIILDCDARLSTLPEREGRSSAEWTRGYKYDGDIISNYRKCL